MRNELEERVDLADRLNQLIVYKQIQKQSNLLGWVLYIQIQIQKDTAGKSDGAVAHPYPQDINPDSWLPHIRGSGKLKI